MTTLSLSITCGTSVKNSCPDPFSGASTLDTRHGCWCEEAGLDDVFGLARNARLQWWLAKALRTSRRRCAATGKASRRFRERRYRTRTSWSRKRRVVGKAEWLPGLRGDNPRFVVTNLPPDQVGAQRLYEQVYCGRGDMENRIKEQQLWLFADRTSTATMRANQLRLTFATFAGVLMTLLRQAGLSDTALAGARADTIRARLIWMPPRLQEPCRAACDVHGLTVLYSACGCDRSSEGSLALMDSADRFPIS